MAELNSSNIVNGNIVEPNDLLQLYSALTAGGGYNVSISGSLTGSATSATTATTATTASNITTAITGGGTHYLTFVDQAGTRPTKIASLLEYTAATNTLQVTASRAITASFALNANPTQLNSQHYTVIGTGPVESPIKFVAGLIKCSTNAGSTPAIPALAGKTLGTNAWITATIEASSATAGNVVFVKAIQANGSIDVVTAGGSGAENVHYHVIYVP